MIHHIVFAILIPLLLIHLVGLHSTGEEIVGIMVLIESFFNFGIVGYPIYKPLREGCQKKDLVILF